MASSSAKNPGEQRRKGWHLKWCICQPEQLLHVMDPFFSNDGLTSACRWEGMSEFLILLCLLAQIFLYLSNCDYLNPWFFSLSFFESPLHCTAGEWTRTCVMFAFLLGLNHKTYPLLKKGCKGCRDVFSSFCQQHRCIFISARHNLINCRERKQIEESTLGYLSFYSSNQWRTSPEEARL